MAIRLEGSGTNLTPSGFSKVYCNGVEVYPRLKSVTISAHAELRADHHGTGGTDWRGTMSCSWSSTSGLSVKVEIRGPGTSSSESSSSSSGSVSVSAHGGTVQNGGVYAYAYAYVNGSVADSITFYCEHNRSETFNRTMTVYVPY